MVYCCGGLSDIGNFRENNEDCIFYSQRLFGEKTICFAAVCDGIGGMRDGEIASGIMICRLEEWFLSIKAYSGDFGELCGSLLRQVNEINLSIIEKTKIEDIQTGSTVAAVLIAEDEYFVLNVGDSRVYLASNKLNLISKDDIVCVNGGTRLSQCIGNINNIYINTFKGTVCKGNAFIICSDGLYKHMDEKKAFRLTRHLGNDKACSKAANSLIKYVKKKGERDNITACIIKRKK